MYKQDPNISATNRESEVYKPIEVTLVFCENI